MEMEMVTERFDVELVTRQQLEQFRRLMIR